MASELNRLNELNETEDDEFHILKRKRTKQLNIRLTLPVYNEMIDFQNSDDTIYLSIGELIAQSVIKEISRCKDRKEINKIAEKIAKLIPTNNRTLGKQYLTEFRKVVKDLG